MGATNKTTNFASKNTIFVRLPLLLCKDNTFLGFSKRFGRKVESGDVGRLLPICCGLIPSRALSPLIPESLGRILASVAPMDWYDTKRPLYPVVACYGSLYPVVACFCLCPAVLNLAPGFELCGKSCIFVATNRIRNE